MKEDNFDIVIVGGGASGIMAGISAKRANPQRRVLIVEGSFALGRKLLISGAGRGNILNKSLTDDDYIKYYHSNNTEVVKNVFNKYGYNQIRTFFEDLGIILYEEERNSKGKIFPISEQARNIVKILEDELNNLGVEILLNCKCTKILHKDNHFLITFESQKEIKNIYSHKLILATGGMSYPSTGSDGSGFKFLESFGHNIVPLIPTAVPLLSKDNFLRETSGIKIKATVASFIEDEFVNEVTNDLLFTSYGVSGTAILELSRDIVEEFYRNSSAKITLRINMLPDFPKEKLIERFDIFQNKKATINLYGLLPIKIVDIILKILKIPKDILSKDLSIEERKVLFDFLYDKKIFIFGSKGWNEAEFSIGGLNVNEVEPQTLESLIIPNLYICGEALNVDGDIGGFNLSWAWASGYLAGQSACSILD